MENTNKNDYINYVYYIHITYILHIFQICNKGLTFFIPTKILLIAIFIIRKFNINFKHVKITWRHLNLILQKVWLFFFRRWLNFQRRYFLLPSFPACFVSWRHFILSRVERRHSPINFELDDLLRNTFVSFPCWQLTKSAENYGPILTLLTKAK